MSQNHRHEPQDARIERLLRDRQPTGSKVLDDLAGTTPRANPVFQQQLEDRLLDTLRHHEQRRRGLMIANRSADMMKPRWLAVPLTLVAAMIAVVIAGSTLLTMNRMPSNLGIAAQPDASATMTASATFVPMATPTFTATPIGHVPVPANATPVLGTLPGIIVPLQGTQTALYVGPGDNFAVIDQLDAGTQVNVLGRTEDSAWLRVQTVPGGRDGWLRSGEVELPNVPIVDLAVSATPIPADATALLPTVPPAQDMLLLPIPVDGRIVGEASVYGSLDISAPVIAQISPETLVLITGAAGGSDQERALFQIRLDDGMEGWVDAHLVQFVFVPSPVPNTPNIVQSPAFTMPYIGVVSIEDGPQANMRSEPSYDASVLERLSNGTLVEVLAQSSDWLNVRLEDGRIGWIVATLVQPSSAISAIDALPAPVVATVLPPTFVPSASYGIIMPATGDGTSVLAQPEDYDDFVGVLSTGTLVQVIEQRPDGQWLLIRQYSRNIGIEGWVIAEAVDFQTAPIFSLANPQPAVVEAAPMVASAYQPVVIAMQDLPVGTQITSRDMLAVVYWPTEILPEGIFTDPASLVGYVVADDVAQWQPLLAGVLSENNVNPAISGVLPAGKVAIAIPFDAAQSPALQDGDTVDIYLSMLFADVEGQELAVTIAPEDPQLITQRVVDDALVVHVGAFGVDAETGETPDIITVAVSPEDAEVLTWTVEARLPIAFLPADVSEMNLRFGEDISLLGFTAKAEADRLGLTLYWYAPPLEGEGIGVSVHVRNEAGELVAQQDLLMENALASAVMTTHELTFDQPLEPEGVYAVSVGLYRASDGSRVPITTSDPRVQDNTILLYAFSPS